MHIIGKAQKEWLGHAILEQNYIHQVMQVIRQGENLGIVDIA